MSTTTNNVQYNYHNDTHADNNLKFKQFIKRYNIRSFRELCFIRNILRNSIMEKTMTIPLNKRYTVSTSSPTHLKSEIPDEFQKTTNAMPVAKVSM